ncbi:MAG: tryptophan--tRNA ligase [Candidatus Pacebacteria bacterium]|jgi:tryptophanyl-tRNA synthetase|nr:tryptophan--tRNA ligase [Candidatus Paceibacterota bacterium]
MTKDKKILLSGIKPSGELHIGNYFGALKQFVDLQDDYKCFFMIADYHALNTLQNAKEMRENIIDIALDYLAVGLDPKKAVIFKQSDVSAHTELAWIFEAITTMPYLMRAHAFKDAEAKNKDLNVGTFNYPMLMASDILLYDVDVVPVGQDQKQHIEITRDTAQKFNNTFETETFKLPEPLIIESVAIVPGIDGQKMSKSYKNVIPLFAEDEVIQKLVMSIVTDSSGGRPENVYAIHKLFRDEEYLENLYKEHEGKYKDLKEALTEDIKAFVRPFREKREELAKNISYVEKILEEGAHEANKVASNKLIEAKKAIGVL